MIFKKYLQADGLSQSSIYCILQDRFGFMWFGTQAGLNRFDGINFRKHFSKPYGKNMLINDLIRVSCKDSKNNLWFGTMDDTVSKYNEATDDFTNFSLAVDGEDKNSEFVTAIAEDAEGRIWAGTRKNGLWILENEKLGFRKFLMNSGEAAFEPASMVSALYFDSMGNLWVGTWNRGVYAFDKKGNVSFHAGAESDCYRISSNHVRCILEDESGYLIGTNDGLYRTDKAMGPPERVALCNDPEFSIPDKVTSICTGIRGELWIGTTDNGLYRVAGSDTVENFRMDSNDGKSISDNAVMSLFRDRSNVLWIGTVTGGVNKLDLEQKPFSTLFRFELNKEERLLRSVHSVCVENNDRLWAGTYKTGVFAFDSLTRCNPEIDRALKSDSLFRGELVLGILYDGEVSVWICTFGGSVYRYDTATSEIHKFHFHNSEGIHCVYLQDNLILLGTDRDGLKAIDIRNNEVCSSEPLNKLNGLLNDKTIFSVLCDTKSRIWVGTKNHGLLMLNIDTCNITVYDTAKPEGSMLKDNCIITLFESSDGTVWIGTKSDGLYYHDEAKERLIPFDPDNLSKESIRGFAEDSKGRLWISTNDGIICHSRIRGNFKKYDTTDGDLVSEYNENAYCKSDSGTIFFGGVEGVTYFKPEEIKDNQHVPEIVITDFEIFNEPVVPSADSPVLSENIICASEINLTYRESVFSFKYSSLIFNNPQKNQYAYKMEGFDKDWTYCGTRRRVTYTNLDPGSYVFRVKGSNNDGIWNEEGTSVRINISPPYWKTWWFKSLSALALMAATGLTYRQRLEKIEKEKRSQEEFSRRLIESQEYERKKIASELHHTIAHDVLITKNTALMALKHREKPESLEKALDEIANLASSTMNDVRSISYNLHPHQIDSIGFTKTLRSTISEVARSSETKFTFDIDDVDNLISKEDEINLYRAVQESVSNIIRHADAEKAHVKVGRSKDSLFIIISDNGKGFDPKSIQQKGSSHGLGIGDISERIKLMKGEYKIESTPRTGTTVFYRIPISQK